MAKTMEESKKITGKPDNNKANKINKAAKPGKANKPNSSVNRGNAKKPNTAKKAKSKNDLSNHKYTSYLYKAILIAILAVVFYPPYLRGLFFDTEFVRAELLVFIIFAAFWVYKIIKKEKLVFNTPLEYASFAFVLVYLISIIASVGLNLAVEEWLKYCMYFAVFFILTDLTADFKNRLRVLWAIAFSAIGVCIIGIDAFAGNRIVTLLNNIFAKYHEIMGIPPLEKGKFFGLIFGGRLASTLQYSNTLAAYLIAVFFISVGLTLLSKSKVHRVISSFAGFFTIVCLIFTLSRGAYLILPIMAVLFIIVLPKGTRIKGIISAIIPLIASIPSVIKISEVFNTNPDGNPEIWLWMLPGVALCLILTMVSDYVISFLERFDWKVYIWVFSVVFVVACIGLVVAINAKQPLTLSFAADSQAAEAYKMRSVILEPGKEYRMALDIIGKDNQGNEPEYEVRVFSNNEKEILRDRPNLLKSVSGKVQADTIQAEMDISVPSDSKILYVYFYNKTKGTDITIESCRINNPSTGELVADVPLEYKYIPEIISSRLQDLQVNKSSIERMVFYRNGMEMFGDHWLIGAGGGAWSLLYPSYQSYAYISTQAHNYFLQTGIEAGVVGMLALLFLIFSIAFMFIRQRYNKNVSNDKTVLLQTVLFTTLVTMLSHAAIDFDLSFPAMLLLLWEILALFNAGAKELAVQTGGYKLPALKELKFSAVIMLVIAFALIIRSAMVIGAINSSDKGYRALNESKADLAAAYYENAAELNPFKPEYKLNYSLITVKKGNTTADDMKKAEQWMNEAERLSKYDVSLRPFVADCYYSVGNIPKGIDILESAIKLRPFVAEEWQGFTNICNSAWLYYLQKDNKEQAGAVVDRALNVISSATEANKRNIDPFIFNAATSKDLEQLAYYKDKQNGKELTGTENIAFYSIPEMDIDSNGIPDQWNTTPQSEFILKNENSMLKVEKVSATQDSYIQSRLLSLKPNTKYRIDLALEGENGATGVRYLVAGVSTQAENFEWVNGVGSATFSTPEKAENNSLMLYIDKSYTIKALSITEVK